MRRRIGLLFRSRRILAIGEPLTVAAMIGVAAITYSILNHGTPDRPLNPFLVALLLVGNLVPAMALLVLIAQRVARGRSERSPLGARGGLHVRLVALFSVLAAVPTLLVVIFASLLFQFGVRFWFSDRASVVLQNADRVVQAYINEHRTNLWRNATAMRDDLLATLATARSDDPRWASYFAKQVVFRQLDQAAVIRVVSDNSEYPIWYANLDKNTPLDRLVDPAKLADYDRQQPQVKVLPDRMEAVIPLDTDSRTYLWISRGANRLAIAQSARATLAMDDYQAFMARARTLQLQFNAALLIVSLLTVAIAIWIAFAVADRIVRPIGELVGAARRVAGGDLGARVPAPNKYDEVGRLAAAFNRMTRRLQEQTGALESRRALTEAVLSGVSAGVISVNREREVTLINLSAQALLRTGDASPIGQPLHALVPELDRVLDTGERQAVVQLAGEGEVSTLAVTVVNAGNGHVLTFDDITQQLADQRHAAWSDVARRIAHEIKNPLTPIQLAAERLQRRYGKQIDEGDGGTFEKLVSTIVRQVGDIRRMIDEFSSFARMPKPTFRSENLAEIARQSLFLHEVAHPAIRFSLDAPDIAPAMVCDRRQIGQALTNIVKNACEAVEARLGEGQGGMVAMTIQTVDGRLILDVADDGVGLPAERDRLTEPYVTTRAKGTGLGLAIVRRIVEEHMGTIGFADRPGGGTIVHLDFDLHALDAIAADDAADARIPELANGRSL
ncbi:MAG TPA: ATP-binding protein [Sphingomonas sp.]|uniref:sensor histidine kinase NtrY-like n=1 Tax=Sphingomonas sp. TaxID=28214 RepID=UPI002B801302|nr:ATP-binding protein [Sphingomonas sp.]HMI19114.1 ATP-binding protein [Sphingomonas sp.]